MVKDIYASQDGHGWYQVYQPIDTFGWWCAQDAGSILLNEIIFDLLLSPAFLQLLTDKFAPLGTGSGWANVQRDVFTYRAVELLGNRINLVIGGGGLLGRNDTHHQHTKK